jgi:transcriptional regulator with XRE-family HTH domain
MDGRWGPGRDDTRLWFVRELRLACEVAGLSQRQLAKRIGWHPSRVSRLLAGRTAPDLDVAERLMAGTGHRLLLKVVPSDGVRLRDSGQLGVAERIVSEAHGSWRRRLELPVAQAPDRRAADLVLDNGLAVLMIEIERWLRDLQAQLRAAQLKRAALSQLLGRPVALILAVIDTDVNRAAVAPHRTMVDEALPVGTRRVWAAIRSGESPGGDGLLWVRQRG